MSASSYSALLEPDSTTIEAEEISSPPRGRTLYFVSFSCCVALLVALAWPMFSGRVYIADDLGEFHLPLRSFYSQQLAAREAFDWNPDLFGGFYLTGEGQAGTYHPVHWLLYRILPLPIAFDLECLLSYPFMLAGMYLFLRRWRLRREAALFGAMTFTFGGFNLLHFVHPNVVAIVAHLPWLLVAIDVMLRGMNARDRKLAYCAVALLTASQLLLGSPQFVLFSLIMECGYVLWVASLNWRVFVHWASAILIGCVIGGIQLLPSIDALMHSVRHTAGTDLAAYGSLHPLNLIQLVAPYLFTTRVVGQNTHELGLYIGAVPLVLAMWWLFAGRGGNRRRLTAFATVTAGVAILWAFGADGPLGWLEAHLPLINRFRFPSRAMVLFQLAVATLAALGIAALMRQSTRSQTATKLWWLPAASIAVTVIATLCWPQQIAGWPLVAAGPVLLTMATWLVIRASIGSRWALAAIVAFAAADLGAYGLSYSVVGRNEPLADYIHATEAPPGAPNGRVAIDLISGTETANGEHGPRVGDRILLTGWKCIDGYLGLEPARQLDYRQPAALRAAGVTLISKSALANLDATKTKQTGAAPSGDWSPISNPQPRAWLVTKAIVSSNPAADISHVSLADEALVEQSLASPLQPGTSGSVKDVADRTGQIELEIDCPTPQLLIVSESFHDGWRGTIDGQPTGVVRANGDFLGLAVPAGGHKIGLEFRPKSLDFGLAMTRFGLGLIVVIICWPWRRPAAN